jgi:hypothetical protein
LSEEKKAKMKAFTKDFTHKVLKRLKEKGKLKRPASKANGNGSSSTPLGPTSHTPALSTPTPTPGRSSVGIETPSHNGHNGGASSSKGDQQLVDDIFGGSDEEMDLDDDDDENDADEGSSSLAIKTPADTSGMSPFGGASLQNTPRDKAEIRVHESGAGDVDVNPSPEQL